MKIFLTGSTGYLGSNILNKVDGEVYCYNRGDDIKKSLNDFQPDCIIHCAGEIYKHEDMFKSNVILTYDILEYLKQNRQIKMIYIGSSSEYGKVNFEMSEKDIMNPYNMYASTKSCATLLCQSYAREFDIDICVLRPFSIYGNNEPEHRLIPTIYRNIINNQKTTLIKGMHDFVYIDDFIRLINILLNSTDTKADIVNCGTGSSFSNLEVFNIMSQLLDTKTEVEVLDQLKPQDSEFWRCDTFHAKHKYNFICDYSFKIGLSEFINYKKQGEICQS